MLDQFLPILVEQLMHYQPYDRIERSHSEKTRQFLEQATAPFSRMTLEGHITASAVLVDESRQFVALIWHEKLERWFQPGGHCEPDQDATLPQAARRELLEETRIIPEAVQLIQATPFDIDVHEIPARSTEPAHFHYDIRYLFQIAYQDLHQTEICLWKPITDVLADPDESRARFARKLQGLANTNP